jgi:integrase
MYTEGREKAKVGRVAVDIHGKSYRLRFAYPEGTRHQFSIAKVSPEGWTTAIKAAQLINRDIDLGDFDDTYARYSPSHAKRLQLAQAEAKKEYNLKELWEMYKEASKNRVAKTTQNNLWEVCNKLLDDCSREKLILNNARKFVEYALKKYAVSTVRTLFRTCINPSVNMGVKDKLIKENPYNAIPLPKVQGKSPECFEPDEVREIIAAFYDDRYVPKSSRYLHSYYAPMVEFLALTGCRPEECHALTWNDIKTKGNRVFVRFNKAYSKGILLPHTKTHTIRLFPCNSQLESLIKKMPKIDNPSNLIFPSIKKGYVTQDNFRDRQWKKIINNLVKQGKIDKYLKPYCLRHSFITRLIREGVDIATVASLSGNSPEIIMKNYLASRKEFDLPEL